MIEVLKEGLAQPPFLGRLARSLSDSVHPADSGACSPGRDAQFELFLAAIATRAGLTVRESGDAGADWILSAPTGRWSLEAKRIKSFNQMGKRFKEGASQIVKSGIGGVIAMDISLACNPNSEPLPKFLTDVAIDAVDEERMNAFVKEHMPSILRWVGSANVGFALLHDFVIRPALATSPREEPWGLIGLWRKVDLVASDASNRQHYDDLWRLVKVAVPNL